MTPQERATVVIALDHDARQPQHALEMGLRNLRLIASDLAAGIDGDACTRALLHRLKDELASVQAAVRQVVDTQQDLVDAMRLETEDTRPTPTTIDADELIRRAGRSNRALAGPLTLHCARSRLRFVSDERWVERMLNNLIANAIRHSGGTKVFVGARRRGDAIEFEVRDNGQGLAPETRAALFAPLQAPARSPIGQPVARSGLGLHNVRRFSARLGGSVECASVPGAGTCFRLRLPGPVERTLRRAGEDGGTGAKVVAILGDDLGALRAAERAFEDAGAEVHADHDPLRWLGVVTDLPRAPDLVVLHLSPDARDGTLPLEVVSQKWTDADTRIVVVADGDDAAVEALSAQVVVARAPLSAGALQHLVAALDGRCSMPARGRL